MQRFLLVAILLILVGAGCQSEEAPKEVGQIIANQPAEDNENTPDFQQETATAVEIVVDGNGEINVLNIESDQSLPLKTVKMTAQSFKFEPASIATQVNQRVEVTFSETSGTHTFVIDEIGLSETVKAGETIQFVSPGKAGSYEFYSDNGNDQTEGMVGILHVKEL